jgi:hypothetical protein
MHAALALHQLQHHCRRLIGDCIAHRVQIVERDMLETGQERVEVLLHLVLAGGGERGHRAPVERIDRGENLEALRTAIQLGPLARQLDGAFVGLGARVSEERFVTAG